MGRDKAFVTIDGRSMLELVTAALGDVVDRVLIVGRTDLGTGFAGLPDPVAGRVGPLAGLSSALGEATRGGEEAVVLVAVDQPFVRRPTLRRLVDRFDGPAVVPVSGGVRQVTCAVYPSGWHGEALSELESGGSIQSLLDRLAHETVGADVWARWGEDGRSWFSVDDEATLATGIERYGSGIE